MRKALPVLFSLISMLGTSVAFAADESSFKGVYGVEDAQGRITEVARVFQRDSELRIKFKNGCTAVLADESGQLTGGCIIGKGFFSVLYRGRLAFQPTGGGKIAALQWQILEYGDEDQGFVGAKTAYRLGD